MAESGAFLLKFGIGIAFFGISDQIVAERMTDGVGEGGLFTHEDAVWDEVILFKGMAQEIQTQ